MRITGLGRRRGLASSIAPFPVAVHSDDAAERLLCTRQPELVTYSGWEAIDRHERALGEPSGRPRVKLTRIEQLLRAAANEQP